MNICRNRATLAQTASKREKITRRTGRTIPLAIAAGLVFAIPACEQRGIEEQEVDKGIEQVPEQSESAAPEQADASAEQDTRQPGPWTVPDGWTLDPEPRQMRLATYLAPDPDGQIEVAVTRFPGQVGGELANINRWRGQMGLPPVESAELESVIERFSAPGFEGYETRIESPSGAMLAAGVFDASNNLTWFVRATITDPAVADRVQDDLFNMARSIAGDAEKDDG